MWITTGAGWGGGVSLLSVVSKLYISVLNARLYLWLEKNATIRECQAGFRKNYSTVDQIINLYAIVQICFRKKGQKLYVAFVDFRKAFVSVRHDKRVDCIRNQGIKGMCIRMPLPPPPPPFISSFSLLDSMPPTPTPHPFCLYNGLHLANTNARLMVFASSLALGPTFGIHSHKTLDTAQPCHLLKPR